MTHAGKATEHAERTLRAFASTTDHELALAIRDAMRHLIQAAETRRSDAACQQAAAT